MSRAFRSKYENAPTPWDRVAVACAGLFLIWVIARWWVAK